MIIKKVEEKDYLEERRKELELWEDACNEYIEAFKENIKPVSILEDLYRKEV